MIFVDIRNDNKNNDKDLKLIRKDARANTAIELKLICHSGPVWYPNSISIACTDECFSFNRSNATEH